MGIKTESYFNSFRIRLPKDGETNGDTQRATLRTVYAEDKRDLRKKILRRKEISAVESIWVSALCNKGKFDYILFHFSFQIKN